MSRPERDAYPEARIVARFRRSPAAESEAWLLDALRRASEAVDRDLATIMPPPEAFDAAERLSRPERRQLAALEDGGAPALMEWLDGPQRGSARLRRAVTRSLRQAKISPASAELLDLDAL